MEPEHITLQKQTIDAVLGSRVHDNAGEVNFINHDSERLQAALFNAYCTVFRDDNTMTVHKVHTFHVLYAVSRVLVNLRHGKVLWDKVVDFGGWTNVGVDYVQKGGKVD